MTFNVDLTRTPISEVCCVAVLLVLGLFVISCKPGESARVKLPQNIDGSVVRNVYENDALGIRIRFPEKMVVDSKEQNEAALKESVDMIKQDRAPTDGARVEEMARGERIVFSISTPDEDDAIGTLNITVSRKVGDDLRTMAERSKDLIIKSKGVRLEAPVEREMLGSLETYGFAVSTDYNGTRIYSKNYGAQRNGFAMTFSISYLNPDGLAEMERVLKGIEVY